jgi:hypothetical protein
MKLYKLSCFYYFQEEKWMFTYKRFPCFECSRNGVHNLVGAYILYNSPYPEAEFMNVQFR